MWLRALLICDDVRIEVGGTMTLVGVQAERMVVEPMAEGAPSAEGDEPVEPVEIDLRRLAVYAVVAGLRGVAEFDWRMTLYLQGQEPGRLLAESREHHDPESDEHRVVHIAEPVTLPGPGRYRLTAELRAGAHELRVDHHFTVERAEPIRPRA